MICLWTILGRYVCFGLFVICTYCVFLFAWLWVWLSLVWVTYFDCVVFGWLVWVCRLYLVCCLLFTFRCCLQYLFAGGSVIWLVLFWLLLYLFIDCSCTWCCFICDLIWWFALRFDLLWLCLLALWLDTLFTVCYLVWVFNSSYRFCF